MASRPVFLPVLEKPYVKKIDIEFTYYPGFSMTQKQKNILAIHEKFKDLYNGKLLEISSKSMTPDGVKLSAFKLLMTVPNSDDQQLVENVYQSGKVFEHGGPYVDLLYQTPLVAKRDERLRNSGRLIGYMLGTQIFPSEPQSLFYDYLYIKALMENKELADVLQYYDGFTDIEFNPNKSINCQARAAARYVGLVKSKMLDQVIISPEKFRELFIV